MGTVEAYSENYWSELPFHRMSSVSKTCEMMDRNEGMAEPGGEEENYLSFLYPLEIAY
jgi:hypothetical protein